MDFFFFWFGMNLLTCLPFPNIKKKKGRKENNLFNLGFLFEPTPPYPLNLFTFKPLPLQFQ